MKNARMFIIALLVLAMALLACGIGGGGSSEEESATPAAGEAGGSEVTPPEEVATLVEAGTEQDLTLSTVTEGLAALQSYKSTFTMKFSGKDEQGQPVSGSWETQEDFVQEPRAQRIAVTSVDSSQQQTGQSGTFEMIIIGDTSYMLSQDADGQRSCVSMSSSEGANPQQGLFSPDMLGGVSDAKYVNTETVNGIRAKHYAWKESNQAVLGFASSKGEVWVAADGNYTVKYVAEATGKGMLFGSAQQEGTITVEYNLTDVNGSFTIEAPAECEAPATDIPVMADAQDKSTFGEMISYSSPSEFADVVAFYKAEMPNNGWQPSGEPTEVEGMASLDFTKENRTAQVMITYDTDTSVTNVIVTTSTE